MVKREIVDFDPGIPDWEKEDEKQADAVIKLQDEFLKREEIDKIKEEKIEELSKKKITTKEKKELEKKADTIKKLYALDFWMRCFNRVSYSNLVPGQALFHVCLGQSLNTFRIYLEDDSSIDWRFHFLWIQDSGSGKGKAMNFVNRVFLHPKFKKMEDFTEGKKPPVIRKFRTHKLGRMNAASLINTFELDKKGNILRDDNDMEKIKLGVLEKYDFIFSEEARALLESSLEALELQEILMTAMEPIGSINNVYTKDLTNYIETCETRCTASLCLTSRPFGKVKITLVESGLIPRTAFFPRKLTFEDREKMNKMSSFAFKTAKTKTPFQQEFDRLVNELLKVVKFAHEFFIDFDENKIDDLLSFLHEMMMWFTKDVEENVPSEENKYILQSFVSRYKDNMVVMAFHSAAMRFSKKVERQDLQYAFDFFKVLYEAQKLWVSLTVEEDKEVKMENQAMRKEIVRYLKLDLNKIATFATLTKHLCEKFNKEYVSMSYHVKKFSVGTTKLIHFKKGKEVSPDVELVR